MLKKASEVSVDDMVMNKMMEEELDKIPRWKAMRYLNENGETSVYTMAKDLGWRVSKAHAVVNSLVKAKVAQARAIIRNNRIVKLAKLANN